MKGLKYCMVSATMSAVNQYHISDAGAFGHQEATPKVDMEYFLYGSDPGTLGYRAALPTGSVSPMVLVRAVFEEWAQRFPAKATFIGINLHHAPQVDPSKMSADLHAPFLPEVKLFLNPSRDHWFHESQDPAFPPLFKYLPQEHSVWSEEFAQYLTDHLPTHKDSTSIYTECVPGGTSTAALAIRLCLNEDIPTPSSSRDIEVHRAKAQLVSDAYLQTSHNFNRTIETHPEVALTLCCDSFQYHMVLWIVSLAKARHQLPEGSKVILGGGSQMLSVLALVKRILGDSNEWDWVSSSFEVVTTTWLYTTAPREMLRQLMSYLDGVKFHHPDFTFKHASLKSLKKYDMGYTTEGCGAGAMLYVAKEALGLTDEELTAVIEKSVERNLPQAA